MRALALVVVAALLSACALGGERTVTLNEQQDRAEAQRYCEEQGDRRAYPVEDPDSQGETYQCL